MQNPAQNTVKKNSIGVTILIVALFAINLHLLRADMVIFQDKIKYQIPFWFIMLNYSLLFCSLSSLLLIYFRRKIGVIVFPLALIAHFVFHVQFIQIYQYFSLFALFIFTIGLVSWLPKWEGFK